MRNEIDIKEKSRGAIRNISGLNEEFQGMKLQFHRDGTPVSRDETPAHTSKNHPAFRNLSLLTLLLLFFSAGWNENVVWGQTTFPNVAIGQSEEIRYVIDDTNYEIKLQRAGLRDNLNAYIHWYKEGNSSASLSSSDLNRNNDGSYSWNGLGNAPAGRITYRNSNVQNTDNDVLVCEATSIQNGRMTMVRRYLIREASDREMELDEARTKAINAGWNVNSVEDLDKTKIDQLKANFFESYEIHTPMESGTSYRLAEVLSNYIVEYTTTTGGGRPYPPTTSTTLQYPNQVRWRIYDSDGKLKKASRGDNGGYYNYTTRNNNTKNHREYVTDGYVILSMDNYDEESYPNLPNIFSYYYPYDTNKTNEQQVFYLTAEVSYNGDKWYPVSFLTVYLEPNSETLTQDDLDDIEDYPDNVNYRRTSKYLSEPRFKSLGSVTFDGNDTSLPATADDNYPTFNELSEILKASSYYAFAAPRFHESRRGENRFVGSGEYGLYKTLGFDNISPQNITVSRYNDIYYSNYALETYKVQVADRLHETDNSKYGYFFYLDAAEEPGIITKIDLGNSLCPNTRIIVTAWVCNLQTTDSNNDGSLNADIGLTFKGVLNDEETILTKFYSGEIKNNPATSNSFNQFAKWQQVYFEFDYKSEVEYQNYILEVANNCRHAHGADYAIDDIQVYCSTPNIQVGRVNACDASTLAVDTDFETILQNMAWYENQDVTTDYPFNELSYRKYRYGLMGTDHSDPGATNATVGNAYFAFFDGPRTAPEWIIVNNSEDAAEVPAVRNTIRVIISTNKQQYPATEEDALEWERELNIRAIKDYNNDIALWQKENAQVHTGEIPIENIDTDETVYNTAIKTLYTRLEIPRIRCPWAEYDDGQLIIHLTKLNVADTNMKYVGQDENDDDEGHYHVILFRASEIAAGNTGVVDPSVRCALISDFYVTPATDILIEADAKAETALCLGAYRNITPALVVYDDEGQQITDEAELEEILGSTYIFDWYLSTSENYDLLTGQFKTQHSLSTELMKEVDEKGAVKAAIDTYRSRGYGEDTSEITAEEVRRWMTENPNNPNIQACGTLLLSLLTPTDGSDPLLRTGTPAGEVFKLQVNSGQIMAMPYVKAKDGYLICTTASPVDLPVSESFIPIILSGIHDVDYQTSDFQDASVPLRLGLDNISESKTDIKTLTLPIRSISKADNADYLGLPTTDHISILLDDEANNYPAVGEITTLHITNTDVESGTATLSFHLTTDAKTYLEEGGKYNLLIPFVQYGDADNDGNVEILASECDGWISLPIKVVPKYLTWKGGATSVWYNDESSWAFSTKGELYNKSDVTHTAENTYTFSPLYFTKITIPEGSELALEDKEPGTGVLTGLQNGATKDIEYDLAVENNTGKIGAYYINEVSEIYFKPKAMLKGQQHLNYQKAWVEFEMEKNAKYWLASPLQDVFAGDMYAPKGTARQTTAAFTDIHYTDATPGYDRWNPAFYQKAWDKGITYYDNPQVAGGDYTPNSVSVVHSNWSIEYNNVDVPYTLGKGFYASVEDFDNNVTSESGNPKALVRLPKADEDYSYIPPSTKVASSIAERTYAGRLAGSDEITIILIDEDSENKWGDAKNYADGDGKHFLIGNPYMYPLDIQKFFSGNLKEGTTTNESIFEPKYWTLQDGTSTVIVGTPDVGFGDGTGAISELGQIAPMQAFFVELKEPLAEGAQLEVKFTPDMMAEQATTRSMVTKSYTATNPQLTLTASSAKGKSRAAVVQSFDASNQYESERDAVTLLDSELDAPTVYTVAGNYAAAVNAVHDCQNIPLGVYAKDNEEVELTIEGASQLTEPLYLYDAVTRSSTPIEGDSYTLNLTGSSHGRYFLTTDAGNIRVESDIRIYSPNGGQLIIAASPSDKLKQVQIYDLSGRMVESRKNIGISTCQLNVTQGIYIVRVISEQGSTEAKLRIR